MPFQPHPHRPPRPPGAPLTATRAALEIAWVLTGAAALGSAVLLAPTGPTTGSTRELSRELTERYRERLRGLAIDRLTVVPSPSGGGAILRVLRRGQQEPIEISAPEISACSAFAVAVDESRVMVVITGDTNLSAGPSFAEACAVLERVTPRPSEGGSRALSGPC